MALKDITVETAEVLVGSGSFHVRGISPADINAVLTVNRASVELLFDLAESKGINSLADIDEGKLLEVAQAAVGEVPDLIAGIIAQCEDEGSIENWMKVRKLPITVQIDALTKIAKLTFTDATNFGVFLGNVMAATRNLRTILPTPPTPKNGASLRAVGMPH